MHIFRLSCFLLLLSPAALFVSCNQSVKHPIPDLPAYDKAYYDYALASVEAAIRENPDNADAYYKKAELLLHQNKANQALASIRKAIALKGKTPAYLLTNAKAMNQKGHYREAFRQAKEAMEMGTPSVELYEVLAEASLQSNYFNDALKYSDSALYLAPKNYRNYFRKGIALAAKKDTVAAETLLMESIHLGASPAEVYGELISLYMNTGDFHKARKYMQKSLSVQNPDDQTLLLQAKIYRQTGNPDSARALLYRVADSPTLDKTEVYQELKDWYFQHRVYDSVIFYANRILEQEPNDKEPMLTLARVYDQRRSYQRAIQAYEQIISLDSMQQEDIHKIAHQELDQLKRKVAYLWKKQQEEELFRLQQGITPLPALSPGQE